jgi:ribosomal protein S18 acetylase RimI-like enzyme
MSLRSDQFRARAHLNLVDSSRQLFEFDPGASIDADELWLLGAGRSPHPAISNAAFRRDNGLDPDLLLEQARAFFGAKGRGFSLWVRDAPEDRDLIAAAETAGLRDVHAMPEMVLPRRAEERGLSDGSELRRLSGPAEAEDFWRVATAAYASNGFPPEIFRFYENHDGFLADNVAAFLAYQDGAPVAIAMTIVSHGVAGAYWVGSLEQARGRGLGSAMTAAATNAGFDLGAEIAALQASRMGEPIYAEMGYEKVDTYRLLMSPPP